MLNDLFLLAFFGAIKYSIPTIKITIKEAKTIKNILTNIIVIRFQMLVLELLSLPV